MTAQAFGDEHTRKKLETVEEYLGVFTTALKRQNFDRLYVDACAGSGSSIPKSALSDLENQKVQSLLLETSKPVVDTDQIILGSAVRALGVDIPFDRYLFNDVKKSNVTALRSHVNAEFQHLRNRVTITQSDANKMLLDLCKNTDWKSTRAVVFIDPFGLQIKYATLEELAKTQAIDLWYLVPVFAMYRQVRGDGEVLKDGGKSVDEALGTDEWRHVVAVKEKGQIDLFGESQTTSKRTVDVKWFESVAMNRLKIAFDGRVVEQALPLGRKGMHEFSLMFAWANPDEKAKLAAKLAKAVLK